MLDSQSGEHTLSAVPHDKSSTHEPWPKPWYKGLYYTLLYYIYYPSWISRLYIYICHCKDHYSLWTYQYFHEMSVAFVDFLWRFGSSNLARINRTCAPLVNTNRGVWNARAWLRVRTTEWLDEGVQRCGKKNWFLHELHSNMSVKCTWCKRIVLHPSTRYLQYF